MKNLLMTSMSRDLRSRSMDISLSWFDYPGTCECIVPIDTYLAKCSDCILTTTRSSGDLCLPSCLLQSPFTKHLFWFTSIWQDKACLQKFIHIAKFCSYLHHHVKGSPILMHTCNEISKLYIMMTEECSILTTICWGNAVSEVGRDNNTTDSKIVHIALARYALGLLSQSRTQAGL